MDVAKKWLSSNIHFKRLSRYAESVSLNDSFLKFIVILGGLTLFLGVYVVLRRRKLAHAAPIHQAKVPDDPTANSNAVQEDRKGALIAQPVAPGDVIIQQLSEIIQRQHEMLTMQQRQGSSLVSQNIIVVSIVFVVAIVIIPQYYEIRRRDENYNSSMTYYINNEAKHAEKLQECHDAREKEKLQCDLEKQDLGTKLADEVSNHDQCKLKVARLDGMLETYSRNADKATQQLVTDLRSERDSCLKTSESRKEIIDKRKNCWF